MRAFSLVMPLLSVYLINFAVFADRFFRNVESCSAEASLFAGP